MDLKLISSENFFDNLGSEARAWQEDYLAMYSSQWAGFVTDPDLMLLPMDDHLVHRGDGVFDVMRCVQGKIYQMESHLKRLERSAKAISLELPSDYDKVREIIKTLVLRVGEKDCTIRVMLSRGSGSFSANPFDCPSSRMYIIIIRYHPLTDKTYKEGVSAVTSTIPVKQPFFANIKSCNYLQNVLIKMEAVNAGYPYALGFDDEGFLAEGSTESVGILSGDDHLKFPGFENTLAGVTLSRVFELADILVKEKVIKGVRFAKIPKEEVYRSKEMMIMGTTINLIPIVSFDGKTIGNGSPGPLFRSLLDLLRRDMAENQDILTEI